MPLCRSIEKLALCRSQEKLALCRSQDSGTCVNDEFGPEDNDKGEHEHTVYKNENDAWILFLNITKPFALYMPMSI